VRVNLRYSPPAGRIGEAVASWLGESPETQIREDLLAFKKTVESNPDALRGSAPGNQHQSGTSSSGSSGTPRTRYHIGELVYDASGRVPGKVIGIEQLAVGTIDPSNHTGLLYSVQWEGSERGEGQLRYDELQPRSD